MSAEPPEPTELIYPPGSSWAPILIAVGAIAFTISDLFVARERFVQTGFANGAIGLPLYFGSQLLLAYSVTLAPSG